MSRDDTHERCGLPNNAVITAEVEFVGYIEPGSTDMKFATRTGPDSPASTVFGLVEMGKHQLLHEAAEEWGESA